jgi:hypothetical protein
MDLPERFMTEEFVRYAAECRRMARLARKPVRRTVRQASWRDSLAKIRGALRPGHYPAFERPVYQTIRGRAVR